MFTDDFDDGTSIAWEAESGQWKLDPKPGDVEFSCKETGNEAALTSAGLAAWDDYEMSVDLESISSTGEAGIVFHLVDEYPDNPSLDHLDYYYLSFNAGSNQFQVRQYDDGVVVDSWPEGGPKSVTVTQPMVLRMTRLENPDNPNQPRFLCYANGAQIEFTDTTAPYLGGQIGLLVQPGGTATFDNVTVHGQSAFLAKDGSHEILFDDPFTRIDIDGTPYMWGLLGTDPDPLYPNKSAWQVVKDDSAHGLVLKGTASGDSNNPTEAFRGDREWINDLGETDYMNYYVQADVKLDSGTAKAGLCLRVAPDKNALYGDRFYELHLDAANGWVILRERGNSGFPNYLWGWQELVPEAPLPAPADPDGWYTVTIVAVQDELACFIDGNDCFHDPGESPWIKDGDPIGDGLVGLWVEGDAALFDNVEVIDLRY